MNANMLFPQIGKVIASTGSRHFPRMLHDLILTQLTIDATQIRQLRAEPVESALLDEAVFCEQHSEACDTTTAQLHLSRRKDGFRYVISVYRSRHPRGFSARERALLHEISPVLLPMVEKHISALQPALSVDASVGLATVRQRFIERLRASGLALSKRELEVCVGLLAGHTAPELAEQLALKVNTVESYLKRASIKLGISGRHSLTRWMYSPLANN